MLFDKAKSQSAHPMGMVAAYFLILGIVYFGITFVLAPCLTAEFLEREARCFVVGDKIAMCLFLARWLWIIW